MRWGGSSPVVVKFNTEISKRFLDDVVVFIDDLSGGNTFFFGLHRYGHTVLITAANKQCISTNTLEISGIDVRGYIYTCQVPDVYGAIGVG